MTLSGTAERLTDATAVAAVASPVWLPWLQTVSEISALLLPFAGLVWLVIQMIFFLKKETKS
jgi:hypothetical protein